MRFWVTCFKWSSECKERPRARVWTACDLRGTEEVRGMPVKIRQREPFEQLQTTSRWLRSGVLAAALSGTWDLAWRQAWAHSAGERLHPLTLKAGDAGQYHFRLCERHYTTWKVQSIPAPAPVHKHRFSCAQQVSVLNFWRDVLKILFGHWLLKDKDPQIRPFFFERNRTHLLIIREWLTQIQEASHFQALQSSSSSSRKLRLTFSSKFKSSKPSKLNPKPQGKRSSSLASPRAYPSTYYLHGFLIASHMH